MQKGAAIRWGFAILHERKLKSNRLDIVAKDYIKRCVLIDLSVPTDKIISVKEYKEIK